MRTLRKLPVPAQRSQRQNLVPATVVLLLSAGVPCLADNGFRATAGSVSRTVPGRPVVSWISDPFMTERQEVRILSFLKSDQEVFGSREISLGELAAELNKHAPTWLDRQALDDLGLPATEPVTLLDSRSQLSLATRLLNVLQPIDCTFVVRHGLIRITSRDVAEDNIYPRVYDVTPLVASDPQNISYATTDFDSLIQAVTSNINPDGWDIVGGNSTLAAFLSAERVLLTASTDTVTHLEIQAYLDALNRATPRGGQHISSAQQAIARREFLPQGGTAPEAAVSVE